MVEKKDTKKSTEKIEEAKKLEKKNLKEEGKKIIEESGIKDEKVNKILKKAKEQGKITYADLAKELDDVNPDQIDKVFDAFEEMGVNLLSDDMEEEPDIDDLKEVEDLKLDEIIERKLENKWLIDTVKINEEILQKAGLKKENIIDITKQYVTMGGIRRIKKAHEGI